jgi:hypothetical protein
MLSEGSHAAAVRAAKEAWGGRMRARIVRTLVSEWSWMGFPGRGDHAAAARRSKGASPRVKLTLLRGDCTWRRAQWWTTLVHAHAHTWQQREAHDCPDGLVGTLLSPSIAAQQQQWQCAQATCESGAAAGAVSTN